MSRKIIHVAIFDGQMKGKTEQITIRRSVDSVILVYPFEEQKSTLPMVQWYENLGIQILTVPIDPNDFQNALSEILGAIDDYCIDDYIIEFNVASQNTILTIAACFAALIIRAPIISLTDDEPKIIEIQSAEITTLTAQKRRILELLSNHVCAINQNDIARDIELSRSNISRHIKSLERAGYVKRKREGKEKRVQITNLGTTILRHKLLRKRRIWGTTKLQSTEVYSSIG